MMKLMKLEDIKPGMKTAQQVTDSGGMLLLKENSELTPIWVQRLRARKVDAVYVIDDSPDGSAPGLNEDQIKEKHAKIDKSIDDMFSDHASDEMMGRLAAAAKEYLKGKNKI